MTAPVLFAPPLCCPTCSTEFEAYAVNESQEIASCRQCGKVVDLGLSRAAPLPAAAQTALVARPRSERARVALPAGLTAFEQPGGLVVTWTRTLLARLSAVAPVALVCGVLTYQLRKLSPPSLAAGLTAAIVLCGLYLAAGFLLNCVRIVAERKALFVRVGPVPWPGGRRLAAGAVRQLFCEAREVPDRNGKILSASYVLSAVVGPEGRRVELLTRLPQVEQALWLEQALEKALGIRDVAVGGEVEPRPAGPE